MSEQIKEVDAELRKMTKKDLIDKSASLALELETYKLRCQTAIESEREAMSKVASLEKELDTERTKLDKAEAYVEQGRAMIEAIMERWYKYDT